MSELDLLDRRVMYELDLNARASAAQIAKKLRKSKETISFRINRLLREGYLNGFYTVFNTSKIGSYYYKVYVKFKNITPEKEAELFDYILHRDHISYLADVEGYYDCIFLVLVRNSSDMVRFIHSFMKRYGEYIQQKDIVTFLTVHRFNQRFLFAGEIAKDWHYPIPLGDYRLDAMDRRILELLSTDARISLSEIAKKTSSDPNVVKYRMRRLEKDGIILAYVTSPNFAKLGLQFIQINISLRDPTVKDAIIGYFNSTDKCLFAIELLGKYDLLAEIHVKNNDELREIIDGFRKKFVRQYNDYDVHTINREYTMVWGPFSEKISSTG